MKFIPTLCLLLFSSLSVFGADKMKPGGPNGPPNGSGPSESGKPDINSEEAFNRFDINRDGVVIKIEFLASPMAQAHPDSAEKFFSTKDRNNDKLISKAEWAGNKIDKPPGGGPGGEGGGKGAPNGKQPKRL